MIIRQYKIRSKGLDKYSKICTPLNLRISFCPSSQKVKRQLYSHLFRLSVFPHFLSSFPSLYAEPPCRESFLLWNLFMIFVLALSFFFFHILFSTILPFSQFIVVLCSKQRKDFITFSPIHAIVTLPCHYNCFFYFWWMSHYSCYCHGFFCPSKLLLCYVNIYVIWMELHGNFYVQFFFKYKFFHIKHCIVQRIL